jgi:hypothetical protein
MSSGCAALYLYFDFGASFGALVDCVDARIQSMSIGWAGAPGFSWSVSWSGPACRCDIAAASWALPYGYPYSDKRFTRLACFAQGLRKRFT